jgi:hypothetical protein
MKKDTQILWWQRAEGGFILAGALWWYHLNAGNWWLFLLFLFSVDISCLGYLKNPRVGAFFYNLGHSLILPITIMVFAHPGHMHHLFNAALIWAAHIGFDRMSGYGLKYQDSFKHTHLGMIGKKK